MIGTALTTVFDALEYLDTEGLVTVDTPDVGEGRAYVWQEIRKKLEIDAAYFHGNVPVVYFKEFSAVDDDSLTSLHRSLWNHNRAPLLIAVLPHEVRVYNCFAPPQPESDQLALNDPTLLKQAVQQVADVLALRGELSEYRRREIESGRFVRAGEGLFGREHRVDNRLLENLGRLRKFLIDDGLSTPVANNLLGRSIFVRYLEDRGVINPEFYSKFASGRSFYALLEESWQETYQLFDELASRFNGDLFPINDLERSQVKPQHLRLLGRFLGGQAISSGQMYFWAYDFKYIPIELISAIYEKFLDDARYKTSAYYTPPEIVDFVLNEVLPFETETKSVRILDPACGSGIFLVEAYRRLVMRHSLARGDQNPNFDDLRDLLTESIYGVDLSEDAIQVAAFSCYLAILEFLEPKSIWETVRFPRLKGTNLFVSDFFDTEAPFNQLRYDLIVGNPPWQSSLTRLAADYVRLEKRPVGNQQAAQAFLWRAPELLAEGGRVCLLAPSKGVLFNQSNRNQQFRQRFFSTYHVTQLVDFSTFRHSLFRGAVAPMVAVFYRMAAQQDNGRDYVVYTGLHPSPLSEGLAGVVVFGDEVKRFSRDHVIGQPNVWKAALWGTPRDMRLIKDLHERYLSLQDIASERGWLIGEGVKVTGPDANYAPKLADMRYVPVRALSAFHISTGAQERIDAKTFHRNRDPKLFKGPHILIRGGVRSGGFLSAAFLSEDAVFNHGMIGIAGPPESTDDLKVVCAYINSSLNRYYQFLTAGTWGVERDVVRMKEYASLPCAVLVRDTDPFNEMASLVDQIQESPVGWDWHTQLDDLVYRAYGLTPAERQLVEDTLETTVDRYYTGVRSRAFAAPSTEDLIGYSAAFSEVFEAATGGSRTLQHTVYQGSTPYRVISFQLAPRGLPSGQSRIGSEPELDDLLVKLEQVAIKQHSRNLYFQRNVKVFEREAVHIVKPAERRFWTKSAAYNDADETIAQLLRTLSSSRTGQAAGSA